MSDVFLFYSHQDQAIARHYSVALTAASSGVGRDVMLRSGDAYGEVIEAALRGVVAVVLLWLPRSVSSR